MHGPEQPSDIRQRIKILAARRRQLLKGTGSQWEQNSLCLGPKGYSAKAFQLMPPAAGQLNR